VTIALRPVGDIPKVGFRPISMDVAQDKRTTILVTTTTLLDYWLQKIFEGSGPIPKHVRHDLGKGIFYTQAIGFDDHAVHLDDIPVAAPAEASFASALLTTWTQDTANLVPDAIDD
jgi:hypothetical protein